jgi:hypothetical protein
MEKGIRGTRKPFTHHTVSDKKVGKGVGKRSEENFSITIYMRNW